MDMLSTPSLHIESISSILTEVRLVNGLYVASMALLIYDYLLTLDLEISLIWGSRWTLVKVLYLLNRYCPFVDIGFVWYHQFGKGLTDGMCEIMFDIGAWLFVLVGCVAEIILTLRTWVIWDKKSSMAALLVAFFVLTWGCISTVLWFSAQHTIHISVPQLGCLAAMPRLLSGIWILRGFYDFGLLMAIVIRGLTMRRSPFRNGSALSRVVYMDGILYYVYLTGLSVANIIVVLRLPANYQILLIMLQKVITTSLTSRVVFNIRRRSQEE